MRRPGLTNYVAYIDGVKIMHNPTHNETIYILPPAMNGAQFMEFKKQRATEIRQLLSAGGKQTRRV